jgi:hypothetical protein
MSLTESETGEDISGRGMDSKPVAFAEEAVKKNPAANDKACLRVFRFTGRGFVEWLA